MPKYSGSCGCYNREMAQEFGVITAVIYNDIEDKFDYYEREGELQDGYFYLSQTNRADALAIPRKSYGQGLTRLEEAGLIKKKVGYKPGTTIKATWVMLVREGERAAFSLGENDQSRMGENDQSILYDTKEPDSPAESVSEGMRPEVLYSRIHSMFKGPHEMRKQKIEAVRTLKSTYQLSDDTILSGFRAIADNPTFRIKETGEEVTWNLSMLLLRKDLERTAALLAQKSEQSKSAPAKIKGLENYMKFGDM